MARDRPLPRKATGSGTSLMRTGRCLAALRAAPRVCCRASTSPHGRPSSISGDHVVIINAATRQADRPQGRTEDLPLRTAATKVACVKSAPRSSARSIRCASSKTPCAACCRRRSSAGDVPQAEGLHVGRPSARRAETDRSSRSRNLATTQYYGTGRRKRPRRASSSAWLRHDHDQQRGRSKSFPTETLRLVDPAAARGDRDRRALRRDRDDGRRGRRRARLARCGSGSHAPWWSTTPSCARACARPAF